MEGSKEKPNTFLSQQAEQLAIKDTLASLGILIPIVACLQVFLVFTWIFDLTGDRISSGSMIYLSGYVFMFFASISIGRILKKYSRDPLKHRRGIFHAQMTYAWMLPVWAAILSMLDAVTASDTFSPLFYVMANILTMGICYMDPRKWTLIQVVTGVVMLIASVVTPFLDHFTFVSEMIAYVVISVIAGRLLFRIKANSYERQARLSEFLNRMEYDSLTGVYTREAFYRKSAELMEKTPDTGYTMFASDIENFKQVNAIYGNEKGDEVLCYLAGEFRKYGIFTARYGSDQFISILRTSEVLSEQKLDQLLSQISANAPVPNLAVKYGYCDAKKQKNKLPVSLLCDRALLAAKSIQHNYSRQIACYDGPVSQKQLRMRALALDFHEALDRKEFVMWYQPKIDPYTGKMTAAEALIRWEKPAGNILPPSEFMDVYEENGQIIELDEYVFRTICLQQKKWMDSGKKIFPISVNLSRKSMSRPDLVQVYKKIVEEVGIPTRVVPIEITESAAIRSVEIRPIVQEFYENGFAIHMDDFGSGQSSINGLNILHIDVVKIDKSLVDDIGEKNGDTLLSGLMGIIKELGLRIVAEGVENKEQLDFLMENHADEIQGYYYSKPLPPDQFEAFLPEAGDTENIPLRKEPVVRKESKAG